MDPIIVKHSGYVTLMKIDDGRDGNLCIMEARRDLPFDIRRVYYINNLENCVSVRGRHAHRRLWQCLFCINGSFSLDLDDGESTQRVHMYRDNVGVLLGPGLWHEMHSFSTGCVLLVAASAYYDEADYLRDYTAFRDFVGASS